MLSVLRSFLEMQAAEGDVAVVATDFFLCAFPDGLSVFADADHHGGFLAAMADGLQFPKFIRPGEEVLAPLK